MNATTFSRLLIGIAALATASIAAAQTQEVPKAPKGFDVRRMNIERGNVETVEYDSQTVGTKCKLVVYTPPKYDKESKYPVFYLLHGKGGNETHWTKAGSAAVILDNLYADKVVDDRGHAQRRFRQGWQERLQSGFENELIRTYANRRETLQTARRPEKSLL